MLEIDHPFGYGPFLLYVRGVLFWSARLMAECGLVAQLVRAHA